MDDRPMAEDDGGYPSALGVATMSRTPGNRHPRHRRQGFAASMESRNFFQTTSSAGVSTVGGR